MDGTTLVEHLAYHCDSLETLDIMPCTLKGTDPDFPAVAFPLLRELRISLNGLEVTENLLPCLSFPSTTRLHLISPPSEGYIFSISGCP